MLSINVDPCTIKAKASPEMIDAWNNIMRSPHMPAVKKVIFSDPATIIIWDDGTKTVVKVMDGDAWDAEKGFAMAYLKKLLGEKEYKRVFKKYVKPQEELEKDDGLDLIEGLDLVEAVKDYIAKAFNAKKEDK